MDLLDSLANIGFDWRVALANLVNFAIIFWLLSRFVFKPLQAKLDERREKIAEGVENAQKAKRDKIMAEETYKSRVSEAEREANKIIADAREKEQKIVAGAEGEAEKAASAVKEKAQRDIESRREEMEKEFGREAVDVVLLGVRKVLGEEVDKEKNEKIIRSALAEIR